MLDSFIREMERMELGSAELVRLELASLENPDQTSEYIRSMGGRDKLRVYAYLKTKGIRYDTREGRRKFRKLKRQMAKRCGRKCPIEIACRIIREARKMFP